MIIITYQFWLSEKLYVTLHRKPQAYLQHNIISGLPCRLFRGGGAWEGSYPRIHVHDGCQVITLATPPERHTPHEKYSNVSPRRWVIYHVLPTAEIIVQELLHMAALDKAWQQWQKAKTLLDIIISIANTSAPCAFQRGWHFASSTLRVYCFLSCYLDQVVDCVSMAQG